MIYLLALFFICAAHAFRVLRWELFISTYEKPQRGKLFRALSAGYILNAFLPLKLGDLLRADLSGRRMKNGRGFSLATIIIERYLDILVVGLVFGLLCIFGGDIYSRSSLYFYIIAASTVLLLSVILYACRNTAKKLMMAVASLFNLKIEFRLLRFCWALIWGFKDVLSRIRKSSLLLYTAAMWLLYFASYFCFAEALRSAGSPTTWQDVFYTLFAENSLAMGNLSTFAGETASTYVALLSGGYIMLPSLILLAVSFCMPKDKSEEDDASIYLNLLPHLDEQERLNFLELYFSGEHREYVESYLKINRNIEIVRDFSAGSNATTMLCRRGEELFFRKYAFGKDGDKLWEQVQWLKKYRDILPLTDISYAERQDNYCFYDMPYPDNVVSAFEFAHSMPVDECWEILQSVLSTLEQSIYRMHERKADEAVLEKYLETKVQKNLRTILNAGGELGALMKYDELVINGRPYENLPALLDRLQNDRLMRIFAADSCCVIHGDLTIENIICRKSGEPYIIDPNTGNVHESSNLDYAKLLQSIHGGYEFLMAQKELEIKDNCISFPFLRSAAYDSLLARFDSFLSESFDEKRCRSIYYHEIIHWLRLMPYKIEKNGRRAVLFYAGMLIVMNDVFERFPNED